jgi:hypothetical protein
LHSQSIFHFHASAHNQPLVAHAGLRQQFLLRLSESDDGTQIRTNCFWKFGAAPVAFDEQRQKPEPFEESILPAGTSRSEAAEFSQYPRQTRCLRIHQASGWRVPEAVFLAGETGNSHSDQIAHPQLQLIQAGRDLCFARRGTFRLRFGVWSRLSLLLALRALCPRGEPFRYP